MEDRNSKRDIDVILSVFGGEDGGVGFSRIKQAIESFYLQADEGNMAALRLQEMVHSFSRLCDMALNNRFKYKEEDHGHERT